MDTIHVGQSVASLIRYGASPEPRGTSEEVGIGGLCGSLHVRLIADTEARGCSVLDVMAGANSVFKTVEARASCNTTVLQLPIRVCNPQYVQWDRSQRNENRRHAMC
jgi:hypothetical protein